MKTKRSILIALSLALILAGVWSLWRKDDSPTAKETNTVVTAPASLSVGKTTEAPEALVSEWQRLLEAGPLGGLRTLDRSKIKVFKSKAGFLMLRAGDSEAIFKEGKLVKAFHHRLGYFSLGRGGEAFLDWNDDTMTAWDRIQAVAATRSVLTRLGLNPEVSRDEYEGGGLPLKTRSGTSKRVALFSTVRLYDKNNHMIVDAEWRMDQPGGPALTSWFQNIR